MAASSGAWSPAIPSMRSKAIFARAADGSMRSASARRPCPSSSLAPLAGHTERIATAASGRPLSMSHLATREADARAGVEPATMLGHIIPVAGSRVQVPSRRTVFVLWTLVLAATAVLVGGALLAERQTVDDVFIFLRYARNLAEHGRYAFNPGGPGIPVEGTSSVLWTLVLAAAWRAGWRGLGTAKLVSLVAGALVPVT